MNKFKVLVVKRGGRLFYRVVYQDGRPDLVTDNFIVRCSWSPQLVTGMFFSVYLRGDYSPYDNCVENVPYTEEAILKLNQINQVIKNHVPL